MSVNIKKTLIVNCIVILFITLVFFTTISIAQENDFIAEARIIYPWGNIAVQNLYSVKADQPYKIGVSVPHVKSDVWMSMAYGIFQEAEKSGCGSVTFLAAKGYDDLDTQINQTENLVELGVDVIIIAPISEGGNIESCKEAIRRGVPIIFWGQTCKIRNHSGLSTGDDYLMGQRQAEWTAEKLGGKGKIVLLSGPAGTNWTDINYKGILNVLSKYPNIEIVEQRWSDIDPAIGMEITERMMSRYPDVDAFICADVLGHGCGNAVAAAGKQDDILVVMSYPEAATLSMIEEGLIDYTVNYQTVNTGRVCTYIANRVLNDPTDDINGANLYIDVVEVTADNVNTLDMSGILAPEDWTLPSGGTTVFPPTG